MLAPARPDEAVAYLGACFTLIRPTGMSDDHAREWLRVAAQDLAEFPADIIERACAAARREITDHRQLVPFIARECADRLEERRRAMRPRPVSDAPQIEAAEPPPFEPMTDEQLQELSPALRRIGIGAGWLTENDDGTVRWTEQDEESAA